MLQHRGPDMTAMGYSVECTSGDSGDTLVDFKCDAARTDRANAIRRGDLIPCTVVAGLQTAAPSTTTITCTGPATPRTYATGYTILNADTYTFDASSIGDTGASVFGTAIQVPINRPNVFGATIAATTQLDKNDLTTIPALTAGAAADMDVIKLFPSSTGTGATVQCGTDQPALAVNQMTPITLLSAGAGIPFHAVGHFPTNVLVTVTCAETQAPFGPPIEVPVFLRGAVRFEMYQFDEGLNQRANSPVSPAWADAISVKEGATLTLVAVFPYPVADGTPYKITCSAATPLVVTTASIEGTTSGYVTGATVTGAVKIKVGSIAAAGDPVEVTCAPDSALSTNALLGRTTFFIQPVNSAQTYDLVYGISDGLSPYPALSTNSQRPTSVVDGSLRIGVRIHGDLVDGKVGRLTCSENPGVPDITPTPATTPAARLRLIAVHDSFTFSTNSGATETAGTVLAPRVVYNTLTSIGTQVRPGGRKSCWNSEIGRTA